MANRRWKKNNMQKKAVSNGRVAAAPVPTTPARRIETIVRYDILGSQVAELRNQGWQTVHYQFVTNEHELPVLAVVMERVVDVVPSPVVKREVEAPAVVDVPAAKDKVPPFTVVIEPMVDAVPMPTLLDKLKEKAPILAAIDEYGVDAIKAAMDGEVYLAAQRGYADAMLALDAPIETYRFESRLLSAPIPNEDLVIEVNLS